VAKRQLTDKDAEMKRIADEKESLKAKAGRLEDDLRQASRRHEDLSSENAHLRQEVSTLNVNIQSMSHQFK
jgi:FtsZ-binding cell division protein ZapB